ncbi:MAG: AMIN domain-containing protein [Myxococcales bacterium]|nr:AMIN domain-containing protein [Myxococcales bacterium]
MYLRLLIVLFICGGISISATAQDKKTPAPKEPMPLPKEEPPVTPKRLDYRTPKKGRRVHLRHRKPLKMIELEERERQRRRRVGPIHFTYQGIVPNDKDAWRFHKRWEHKKLNYVTWIGFIRRPSKQRVFIQTARAKTYRVLRPSPTRVVIEIDDAKIPWRNDRRPLIVREISTQLATITGKNLRGNQVHVIIDLKRPLQYSVEQRSVNFHVKPTKKRPSETISRYYLFIDFPY